MNPVGGRPREEGVFSWAVGPAHVREELREQGTRDEDLVSIVSYKDKFDKAIKKRRRTKSIRDRQSEAQTSEVHEEPIKSII